MKIDLHCHRKYSRNSYLEPETIIEQAIENGLDGVCCIKHHSIDASNPPLTGTLFMNEYPFSCQEDECAKRSRLHS